ncbi:MAG: class I adenylate-forming enzyme family protein [Acidimicrobiia bacterium]
MSAKPSPDNFPPGMPWPSYDAIPRVMRTLLEQRAQATPDRLAIADERNRTMTFGALAEQVHQVAAGLSELGITRGSRVAWQLPTSIESIVLMLALAHLGSVQAPIVPIYRRREVENIIATAAIEIFIAPDEWRGFSYRDMATSIGADLPSLRLVDAEAAMHGSNATPPPGVDEPDEVRWIYSTSGTVSAAKCVRHSDATLVLGGIAQGQTIGANENDVLSIPFPITHIGGPTLLVMTLVLGIPSVIVERFDITETLPLFRRHGVTLSAGGTAFYIAYLEEQRRIAPEPVLPSLRALFGGGAPKPESLYWDVKAELGVPIYHGYGSTEIPLVAMGGPNDSDEQLATTEGATVPECDVRIERNNQSDLDGEILVRGTLVCHGYTDERLNAELFDENGFLRTGDRGYLRPDGHIVLTGRSKDLIVRKGENINPLEVERVLQSHPAVAAVAVVGLPDATRGEMVCAVIELAHGHMAPTLGDVRDHCLQAGLAIQSVPERLEVVDQLPRNPNMKVLKRELRTRFTS